MSPAFIAGVDPEFFVTFSALQFSKKTGCDSHGRHVSDVAAAWVAIGGNASIVAKVVAMFPPKVGPSPTPDPTPPVPVPVPAPSPIPCLNATALVRIGQCFRDVAKEHTWFKTVLEHATKP
jgi:hypothetical protein